MEATAVCRVGHRLLITAGTYQICDAEAISTNLQICHILLLLSCLVLSCLVLYRLSEERHVDTPVTLFYLAAFHLAQQHNLLVRFGTLYL